jgi:hypothetical protein
VQDLYAVPTFNNTIERFFSSSKNTVTYKRIRLDTEKINKLLFLHRNLVLLKSFHENQINEVYTTMKQKERLVDNHLLQSPVETKKNVLPQQRLRSLKWVIKMISFFVMMIVKKTKKMRKQIVFRTCNINNLM